MSKKDRLEKAGSKSHNWKSGNMIRILEIRQGKSLNPHLFVILLPVNPRYISLPSAVSAVNT